MNNSAFVQIIRTMAANIKAATPIDTGNLAYNATRYEFLSGGTATIYINSVGQHQPESVDGIAPYFPFVNYRKNLTYINKRGQTVVKPNRNYHYWDKAVDNEIKKISGILNATVKKEGEPDA